VTTAPAKRGRPPRGATQLSRQSIVAATLEVIDAKGVAEVSLRAVARHLGVDAKSLYNYVDGLDDLLDAVAEEFLSGLRFPDRSGDTRQDLRAIAHAFRDRAHDRPEAAALVMTRQLASFEGLAPTDRLLAILRAAGMSTAESVHVMRLVLAAVIGMLRREVSVGPISGTADPAAVSSRESALRESGLPHVAEAAHALARFDRDAEFDFGLDFILDAVAARLAR
jgi:AcrR family transcriptional regulator